MTRLSVNINKVAWLRNARGGNIPDVLKTALDIIRFGAEGITVHPRPDERHIRYSDVRALRKIITTVEFNIEGNPRVSSFVDLVLEVKPDQVTLVPDAASQLTSDHGWDTLSEEKYLTRVIAVFKQAGIRTSVFVDPSVEMIKGAAQTGADRVELYTESYARQYTEDREKAIMPYIKAAEEAQKQNLGLNAGHDLNLENLAFLIQRIPSICEVSIGHALVADALYYGWENTIQLYLREIRKK